MKQHEITVLIASFAAAGCNGCSSSSPMDVSTAADAVDIGESEVMRVDARRDVVQDVRPEPPWEGGTYLLTRPTAPTTEPVETWCGSARPVSNWSHRPYAQQACRNSDLLYFGSTGTIGRVQLSDSHTELLTPFPTRTLGGFVSCQTDHLTLALSDLPSRSNAIVQFTDINAPGIVRWSTRRRPIRDPLSDGGMAEFVATDQLIAWLWHEPEGPYSLWVAGPRGENPREIPSVTGFTYFLHAQGNRLVYVQSRDIMLWTVGSTTPENLTNDGADQWHPWIDGDRVVWVDQRDNPSGSLWSPSNPEIYAMDLRTREVTRITNDPADRTALQHAPVVSGDWVVWMDFRSAMERNPTQYFTDVMDIWAYNFTTRRQYPISTGFRASYPTILNGSVYFVCSPAFPDQRSGLFSAPLPTP